MPDTLRMAGALIGGHTHQEEDLLDGSLYARLAAAEVITGAWAFPASGVTVGGETLSNPSAGVLGVGADLQLGGDLLVGAAATVDGVDVSAHDHGAAGGAAVSHGSLADVAADQHHPRSHGQADHSGVVGVIDLPIASLSVSGTMPGAGNDVHDFLVDGFAGGTIKELRATMKAAPTADTTFRVMRNNGIDWWEVGTVTVNAGQTEGATTGLSVSCNAQENYTLDITAGNGSGTNALVRVIATVNVTAT